MDNTVDSKMDVDVKSESDDSLIEDDDIANSDSDDEQDFDESSYDNDNPYITMDHFLNSELNIQDGTIQGHSITEESTEDTPKPKKIGRPCNPTSWKKNKQKLLRNSGQAYISYNNKLVPAKKFIPNYDCGCKKKCNTTFDDNELKNFFESFWKIGNYKLQNEFLRGMISIAEIKRRRTIDGSRKLKNFNLSYNIKIRNESKNVCKKYFLNILQIGWGRVHRIFAKDKINFENQCDKKRLHKKTVVADIQNHIKTFPSFQTLYSRKLNKNRHYLNPKASVRKMYELYEEKCLNENRILIKEKYYYGIFSRKFDLHFKVPNSNVCLFCENLQIKIDSSENFKIRDTLLEQKTLHVGSFENDQMFHKNDSHKVSTDFYVCSFDIQKPLPFPRLSNNVSILKRNLFLNNLSFYSYNNKENYFYYWDETEGGRSSQEITSVVLKHLKNLLTENEIFEKIILFTTDLNCSPALILTLLKLVNEPNLTIKEINLKLMLVGHSFLTNSRDFETIERNSNRNRNFENIYGIEDWLSIFSCTTKKSLKPHCISVDHTDFLDITPLKNVLPNLNDILPNFSRIRWFKFDKGNQFSFFYKENLSENTEFSEICLKNSDKTEDKISSLVDVDHKLLYKDRRPVSIIKKNDIMDLLEFIPEKYRDFYRNLPVISEGSESVEQGALGEDEIIYD